MKYVIHWFGRIVLLLTVLICTLLATFLIPRFAGIKPFVVLSGSMEPGIPTGSVVFVDTKDTDVAIGDVVTYGLAVGNGESAYVTHRVSDILDNGLIQTQGDNNEYPDGYLEPSAITGTLRLSVPYLGYVLDWLQTTGYPVVIFWIVILNLIVLFLSRAVDE